MFLLLLQIIVNGQELVESDTYKGSGELSKFYSIYEKIMLPNRPLITVSIDISLTTYELNVDEYPDPEPEAYIRRAGNPEYQWDYYLDLSSFKSSLIINNIPATEFFIVRIDGGLSNEFSVTPGYGIPK